MALRIGRVQLSTPRGDTPLEAGARQATNPGLAGPTREQTYRLRGLEPVDKDARFAALRQELLRRGLVYVQDSDGLVPSDSYDIVDVQAVYAGGGVREYAVTLARRRNDVRVFEAEDWDLRRLGGTTDNTCSEGKRIRYTPTTSEVPVVRIGSSLALVLRMEANFNDFSGLANHGTGNGGVAAGGVAGRIGNGTDFDGANDYVQVADHPSLKPTKAVTVEAWVKPDIVSAGTRVVLGKASSYILAQSGADVVATVNATSVTAIGVLAAGTWAHLVLTYDKAKLRVYVDGVEKATVALTADVATNTNPVRVGSTDGAGQFFDGVLDEVRVYDRALSADEALLRFDDTKSGSRPATDYRAPLDEALDLAEGAWQVRARVRSTVTATQKYRARFWDKDGAELGAAPAQVTSGAADDWGYVLLTSSFSVLAANDGANVLTVEVQGVGVDLNAVDVDVVEVVPA